MVLESLEVLEKHLEGVRTLQWRISSKPFGKKIPYHYLLCRIKIHLQRCFFWHLRSCAAFSNFDFFAIDQIIMILRNIMHRPCFKWLLIVYALNKCRGFLLIIVHCSLFHKMLSIVAYLLAFSSIGANPIPGKPGSSTTALSTTFISDTEIARAGARCSISTSSLGFYVVSLTSTTRNTYNC